MCALVLLALILLPLGGAFLGADRWGAAGAWGGGLAGLALALAVCGLPLALGLSAKRKAMRQREPR